MRPGTPGGTLPWGKGLAGACRRRQGRPLPFEERERDVNIGGSLCLLCFIMFTMFHYVHYVSLCSTPIKHRDCLVVVPCQTRSARLT